MPRAPWPPSNVEEVFTVPDDPYIRPEDRLNQQEPEPPTEEEPTGDGE